LQLVDVAAQAHGTNRTVGAIPGTGITITQISPGTIQFTFDMTVPQGRAWSGTITILQFTALTTGATTISVE